MTNDKLFTKNINFCGDIMHTPEMVNKIFSLFSLGWGKKKIAKELGISKKTVKHYLNKKEWQPYKKSIRHKKLDGLNEWLEKTFYLHKGNAAVVHQELMRQHQIKVNPSTVERAVKPFRQKLEAEAKATIRFETEPGKQMQIDFGAITITIGNEACKVHFFAAVLGYSRRQYLQVFKHQRQIAWFKGIEGAFRHFGGITEQILIDNARALVHKHNPLTREIVFNDKFHAFASYWKFTPKACAPYRARTKGKDESTVKYIKKNAIAGREFASWEDLEKHMDWWLHEVSDVRIHGTTFEKPIDRFLRDEKSVLKSIEDKPPFCQARELNRIVQYDACIELDYNFYSVPWQLIKKQVAVQIIEPEIKIFYGNEEVACHAICYGKRQRLTKPQHLQGIIGADWLNFHEKKKEALPQQKIITQPEFFRSLSEYEAIVGGGII